MIITKPVQLFTYNPSPNIDIANLTNLNNIATIIAIDSNNVFLSYAEGVPEFLQGFTTLESGKGYCLISKADVSFPYEIYTSTDDIPESVTISQEYQIATYCGVEFNLLDGTFNTTTTTTTTIPPVALQFTQQPQDTSIVNGEATLTVEANSSYTGSIFYSWYKKDSLITGLGSSWEFTSAPLDAIQRQYAIVSAAFGNNKFVCLPQSDVSQNKILVSSDGLLFSEITLPASARWRFVKFANGLFLVFSDNGYGAISSDGTSWTSVDVPTSPALALGDLAYGNGLYVAANGQTDNHVLTSTDGVNWALDATPTSSFKIAFGNNIFCAIKGYTNEYMTRSSFGTWWLNTFPTQSNYYFRNIVFFNNMFIVPYSSDFNTATNIYLMSSDGITWTAGTFPANGRWNEIVYGNGCIIVFDSGTANAYYSNNGIDWELSNYQSHSLYSTFYKNPVFTGSEFVTSFEEGIVKNSINTPHFYRVTNPLTSTQTLNLTGLTVGNVGDIYKARAGTSNAIIGFGRYELMSNEATLLAPPTTAPPTTAPPTTTSAP